MFRRAPSPRFGRRNPAFLSSFPVFALAALLLVSVGAVPAADTVAAGASVTPARAQLDDGVYRYDGLDREIEQGNYEEALRMLRERIARARTAEERARLLLLAAQLEIELENYGGAARFIEAAIATGALSEDKKAESHYLLGRLYLGMEPPELEKSAVNLRIYIEMKEAPRAEEKE